MGFGSRFATIGSGVDSGATTFAGMETGADSMRGDTASLLELSSMPLRSNSSILRTGSLSLGDYHPEPLHRHLFHPLMQVCPTRD
jgi:hypothetical protein